MQTGPVTVTDDLRPPSGSRVQYRFGLGADGRLVDVNTLTPAHRSSGFICIACGRRLIAHLKDDLRARHFAHHRKGACASYESYLHRAAKLAFLETYRECLSVGKAFTLRLPVVDTCNALEQTLGFRCEFPQYREIDLTRWFHAAELEQRHAGFVADVLLLGTRSQRALFVEVLVTHPCDEAKIASGHRILELRIGSDRDIAELLAAIVTVGTDRGQYGPQLPHQSSVQGALCRSLPETGRRHGRPRQCSSCSNSPPAQH